MKKIILTLGIISIGLFLFFALNSSPEPISQATSQTTPSTKKRLSATSQASYGISPEHVYIGETPYPSSFDFSPDNAQLRNDPKIDPIPDAEILKEKGHPESMYISAVANLLQRYNDIVKGGLPVGLNIEVTNALLGKNPKRIALIESSHPSISPEGELMDQWKTPYAFHAESLKRVTIRSAGPDKVMYTEDDIVSNPPSNQAP